MSVALRPIVFNGKFYSGSINGVHRVAHELLHQVDRLIAAAPADQRINARVIIPSRRRWSPQLTAIDVVESASGDSQRWEQLALPHLARDAVLINLCNLAPILHRRKLTMIHDAQFLFPDCSYPPRQRLGYRWLIPLMARTSRHVLTVSQYSRQILDLTGVAAADRSSVLYNGVDHMLAVEPDGEVVARLGLTEGRYVISFGTTKRYKNLATVFAAFASNALSGIDLVVVGDDEAALRAGGLIPPPGAIFAGRASDGVLRALYERAGCLVFPSRTEGFGLPPLEAMLLGCPAVVAPAGAMPEVCRDAVLYAGVDEPDEWVAAIRAMIDDPELRAAKIAAGRQRAACFTWAQAGRALLDRAVALARC